MSQQTPRRGYPKHKRNPSANRVSDYESDAPIYIPEASPNFPNRTNTEINLKVLRTYHPEITHIQCQSFSANTYSFDEATNAWLPSAYEGPLFICSTDGSTTGGIPSGFIYVLNRKNTSNGDFPFEIIRSIEIADTILIMYMHTEPTVGLYIKAETDEQRTDLMQKVVNFFDSVKQTHAVVHRPATEELPAVQAAASAPELMAPRAEHPISAQLYETRDIDETVMQQSYQGQQITHGNLGMETYHEQQAYAVMQQGQPRYQQY